MIDFDALKSPFPMDAISWRAQTVSNGKALALAYVDARDVMNRLDEVCSPAGWQCKYSHANGKTVCDLGIKVSPSVVINEELVHCGEWVWKADGAGDSDIEAEKGALSDAFKRAAVRWGIGRYLYDLASPWVPCEVNQNGKFKCFTADPWSCIKGKKPVSSFPKPKDRGRWAREIQESLNNAVNMEELNEVIAPIQAQLKEMQESPADIDKETAINIISRYKTLVAGFKLAKETEERVPHFIGRAN